MDYRCQNISKKISSLWPVFNNSRNAVIGFGTPFINIFNSNIQRLFFLIPRKYGLHNFPPNKKNLTVSINETTLPIEDLSIDRLLVINFFEHLYNFLICHLILSSINIHLQGNGTSLS